MTRVIGPGLPDNGADYTYIVAPRVTCKNLVADSMGRCWACAAVVCSDAPL